MESTTEKVNNSCNTIEGESHNPPSPVSMSSQDSNRRGISCDDGRNKTTVLTGAAGKRKCPFAVEKLQGSDLEDGEISSDSEIVRRPGKKPKNVKHSLDCNGDRKDVESMNTDSQMVCSKAHYSRNPESSISAPDGDDASTVSNIDSDSINSSLTTVNNESTSNSMLSLEYEQVHTSEDGKILMNTSSQETEQHSEDHQPHEEFEIIDEVEQDEVHEYGQGLEEQNAEGGYDSDDLDDSEIYAWLEEGIEKKGKTLAGGKLADTESYEEREKVVLKEKGHNPFEVLPEGWVAVTHNSSMPVYLHRPSRVCTMSRPYFLGPGSVRKHNIPLSTIPCLQYRRELEKEREQGSAVDTTLTEEHGQQPGEQIKQEQIDANSDPSKKIGQGKSALPTMEVAECRDMDITLDSESVHKYCERLFEFQTIKIKKFKTWKDKRKHLNSTKQQQVCQSLPSSTKLITCPIPQDNTENRSNKRKEFVLNPTGKSHLCILHEYAQHVLRVQPQYVFKELENAQTPYSATVVINEIEYGTGKASSKKAAKLEAAKVTLNILIPKLLKVLDEDKAPKDDLAFFDEINIEDPRVSELCNKAALQNPYQILLECLKRNCGMGDTRCHVDKKMLPNQKCEFTITVGKHTATVVCRNKRDGKQRAAQAMLQRLHPLIKNWGSIMRLYGDGSNRFKEREEKPVTDLQSKANKVNNVILDRLKESMRRLKEQRDAIKSRGKLLVARDQIQGGVVGIDL